MSDSGNDDPVARGKAGESPLVIFISSVMSRTVEDLQWARDATRGVVGSTPLLVPWMFEYTPASSEGLSDGYLRKVREADLVVWLVGRETTAPVQAEIQEALKSRASLLVFELPVPERSQNTLALLGEVKRHVKSSPVESRDSLGSEITDALSDELVRAYRSRPRTTVLDAWIEEEARRSRTRCIRSWVSAGVPFDTAAGLADNRGVGPSLMRAFADNERVRLVTGPLGAGKTLYANRLIQAAAESCLGEKDAPVPLYASGDSVAAGRSLEESLLAQVPEPLQVLERGVVAVIDDVTRLSPGDVLGLLGEAQVFAMRSPRSTVTFIMESSQDLGEQWAQVPVKLLPEQAAAALVSSLSGVALTDVDVRYRWPKSVREAITTPLFAVLLGSYLRDASGRLPKSPVDTVAAIAARALQRVESDPEGLQKALCRLARTCLNWQADLVPEEEVGSESEIRRLVATGLVRREHGRIGFNLQLFQHWYGSLALAEGSPSPAEMTRGAADAWYDPFLLLVRTQSYETVSAYMEAAARADPGFAAHAVCEAVDSWSDDGMAAVPPDRECEKRMQSCMRAWVEGVGRVARCVAPINTRGELGVPRVRGSGDAIHFGWYVGALPVTEAPALPDSIFDPAVSSRDWHHLTFTHVTAQAAWPWSVALEALSRDLTHLLESHALLPDGGLAVHEAAWNWSLRALNFGELRDDPIPLRRLLEITADVPDDAGMHGPVGGLRVGPYRALVRACAGRGGSALPPPWPTGDFPLGSRSGSIVAMYSAERLRSRIEVSFAGALDLYKELVAEWFLPLSPRLGVYSLMPVRLVGVLHHDPGQVERSVLFWYMTPDDSDDRNHVEISIGDTRDAQKTRRTLDDLHELCARKRPERGRFALTSTHFQGASQFVHSYPIMNLAYDWLWGDLARLRWVKGTRRTLY